jgi:hypothetical protein
VQVHHDEGVATHIDPESCTGGREAVREALTGERAGQPLSRENIDSPGADAVPHAEGHTKGRCSETGARRVSKCPTSFRASRPLWDPVFGHPQDRACQNTVGLPEFIQNREVICVDDRN